MDLELLGEPRPGFGGSLLSNSIRLRGIRPARRGRAGARPVGDAKLMRARAAMRCLRKLPTSTRTGSISFASTTQRRRSRKQSPWAVAFWFKPHADRHGGTDCSDSRSCGSCCRLARMDGRLTPRMLRTATRWPNECLSSQRHSRDSGDLRWLCCRWRVWRARLRRRWYCWIRRRLLRAVWLRLWRVLRGVSGRAAGPWI